MKYSQGKSKKVIAVCMAKFDGFDQVDFLQAFERACEKYGYKIFLFSTSVDFGGSANLEAEQLIYDLLEPRCYEAVVIMTDSFRKPETPAKIAKKVVRSNVLCFSFNTEYDGAVTMRFDSSDAFERVVRHIVEHHGKRNVNFISGTAGNPFADDRLATYKRVLEDNGIPVEDDRIGYGDFWEEPTDKVMDAFLASGKPIDAIVCANDYMAMEVCKKLREADIRVPEDILVSGYDGVELEKFHYPRLATAYQDMDECAEKITSVIEAYLAGLEPVKEYSLPVKFRPGQSCGCLEMKISEEQKKNALVSTYEAHRHLRMVENNVELLYEKTPILSNAATLKDVWGDFFYIEGRFLDADFDLCINDDFLNEEMELWPSLRPDDGVKVYNYYTDDMRVPISIRNGELSMGGLLPRAELIPDIGETIEKPGCVLFAPIHVQGSSIGYCACNMDPEKIDFFLLLTYISHVSQILQDHKSRLDQQNLYSMDQLTKLLNRKGFYRHMEERMSAAVLAQKPVCVISLDMNGLKSINDTYGHKEGDFALAKIGEAISEAVGEDGVSTRFGGDEFAIAFTGDDAEARCSVVIGEIRERLEKFNALNVKPYKLSASIGSACHIPDRVEVLERYLMEADKKMYKSKAVYKAREEM